MSGASKVLKVLSLGLVDIDGKAQKAKRRVKEAARPEAPKIDDAEIQRKAEEERRKRARKQGVSNTVLTGTGGVEPDERQLARKTLLGS